MASITKDTIRYSDLLTDIDEQTIENVLFDIKGLETVEDRANDYIDSTFLELKSIAIKVDFDLSDFDDTTGIKVIIVQAFKLMSIGTILNSTDKRLGMPKKKQGMKLLEGLWGTGIYSEKEVPKKEDAFFSVVDKAYTSVSGTRMDDLYNNNLF